MLEIDDITRAEDELNSLMKNYKDTIEKIKQGDDDCKVLKYTISQKKLQLEDKLTKIAQNNDNNL